MRHVTLQDDTQFTTVYSDAACTARLYTLERAPMLSSVDYAWIVRDSYGYEVRKFKRTQFLVNWLVKLRGVRVDCRPIDSINAMIDEAKS